MNNLVIRPTLKTLKLTAELEYLFGMWGEKINENTQNFEGISSLAPGSRALDEILEFEISKDALSDLAINFGAKPGLRTEKIIFTDNHNRPIFTAVSPFIIEQRLNELITWSQQELSYQEIHPLITCALYHLVFLHLHPFSQGNHATALISSWYILKENSSPAIQSISLAKSFLNRSDQYFSALKQAEKSCFADWSSINVWIEFFVETLLIALQNLSNEMNKAVKLNSTQEKILLCVENLGLCKREEITNNTGINIATVKYNLGILTKLGCLKRTGEGRASSYSFLKKMN